MKQLFELIQQVNDRSMLQSLRRISQHVPGLAGVGCALTFAAGASAVATCDASAPQGLDPASWEEVTVVKKEKVNHDSVLVRLGFKDSNAVSGLTTASCLLLKAPIGSKNEDGTNKAVIRPYTPTSDPDTRGYFDLVVKVYEQGKMSKHLGEVNKGDNIMVKGPIKKLPYEANMKKKIGMIAGGSGITPMLQIIDAVVKDEKDTTEVHLVYANKTPADILLKDKLDTLAKTHSNFHVHYVVEKRGMFNFSSSFSTGYVTDRKSVV